MRFSKKRVIILIALLVFSGCVTSQYKDNKGCECTRRYFTIFGISTHSCSDVCQSAAEPAQAQGKELKVAPLAPSPSLRQSTPAQTIAQNIKATTQALGR